LFVGLSKAAPLIKQTVQINLLNNDINNKVNKNTASSDRQQEKTTQLTAQLIGIDPFSEAEIRTWQQGMMQSLSSGSLQRLLSAAGTVLVAREFFKKHQLSIGERISITTNGQRHDLEVIGFFKAPQSYQKQLNNWLISDISTVQELLNYQGAISQIDLLLDSDNIDKIEHIKKYLPEGVQLIKVAEHAKAISRLSQSFELNLTALSFLGLLVAMFLIYNTIMFSVVQRRALLARLRVLGVTRYELFRLVLVEVFIIAVLATTAGLLLGVALAQVLLFFVTRTINDLYYVLQVTQLYWSYSIFLKAFAIGIGATVLSAIIPSLEAAYTLPVLALQRSNLEAKINRWSRWLIVPGILASLLVYWLLKLQFKEQSDGMFVGLASVFTLIAAFICLLPVISRYLLAVLAVLMRRVFNLPGKIAVNNIIRSFSRSIVAIAALTISVSAALGIGIMVESFRFTVDAWLLHYLKSDYYIGAQNNAEYNQGKALQNPFNEQLFADLSQLSAVEYISSNQDVRFFIDGHYHHMNVLDIPAKSFAAFHLKEGDAAVAKKAWLNEDAVLVSEPYAYKHGVSVGDKLYLPVSINNKNDFFQAFKVVGIYYHYGSEQGVINMNLATYQRHWTYRKITTLGLYLASEILQEQQQRQLFEQQLQAIVSEQSLQFVSRETVHSNSLDIFDRTFKVTNVLKLLVVFVSFVGILTALMAIELERSREYAILRVTGLSGRQLSTLVYIETFTMGLVAAVLAMPMGMVFAYLLIEVINYRSFGWSMQFILPWHEFLMAGVLALTAAFLAAVYPAWHLGKTPAALALREE